MPQFTFTTATQIFSITTALVASGGIACLSLFDIPELQAQSASRSLPSIRWLFSRGSHVFPQAAALSSAGFAYLAYAALPPSSTYSATGGAFTSLLQRLQYGRVPGYILAAVLAISIGPFTQVMIPTNFRLIEMNAKRGGARSAESAKVAGSKGKGRTAEDSVAGEDEASQFTDLSGPQERTEQQSSKEEDAEVKKLLGKFGQLNAVRAVLLGLGGMVGLATALA